MLASLYELVLLFLSFKYCYKKYNPRYLKSFPVYCVINPLIILMSFIFTSQEGQRETLDLFMLFELTYFSYLLAQIIDRSNVTRLIWILNIGFFAAVLIFLTFHNRQGASLLIILVSPVVLVIICLIYFKILFSEPRTVSLSKEPSFWLVTGILFHAFFTIPIFLSMLYFFYVHRSPDLGILCFCMYSVTQIVSYVLFTKALICRRDLST